MNIYEKLVEIRKCIDGFTKDKKSFNYSYVSGTQVLSKIYDKMNELKVVLEPHIIHGTKGYEIFQQDTIDKYGKAKHTVDYIVNAEMEYIWINAEKPEERSVVEWALFGQQDDISKAFGSGLTYSERYFLMKYFSVPTDADDPDNKKPKYDDKGSNNTHTDTKPQGNTNVPIDFKSPSNDLISEPQVKRMFGLCKGNVELVKAVLLKHGHTESNKVKKSEYEQICKEIEA